MDCAEFQQIVAGEREADLTEVDSRAFEAHLDSCSVCSDAVGRAEEDLERLAALVEPPALPAAAWARVDALVKAEAQEKPGHENPFAIEVVGPAAPVPLPVAPAPRLLPADPRAVLRARPRSPSSLKLAFAAAVVALTFGVLVPSSAPPRSTTPIGRVRPPEPGDVVVAHTETGQGCRSELAGRRFVMDFRR